MEKENSLNVQKIKKTTSNENEKKIPQLNANLRRKRNERKRHRSDKNSLITRHQVKENLAHLYIALVCVIYSSSSFSHFHIFIHLFNFNLNQFLLQKWSPSSALHLYIYLFCSSSVILTLFVFRSLLFFFSQFRSYVYQFFRLPFFLLSIKYIIYLCKY